MDREIRVIPFVGIDNIRDLGGCIGADGRRVRCGLIYRGANLEHATDPENRPILDSLGLKAILDLRSRGESALHPDPVLPGAVQLRLCAMHYPNGEEVDFSPRGIGRLEQEKEAFSAKYGSAAPLFTALYCGMPYHNPAFRQLFSWLEERRVPMLFHCMAGKDRTGMAAMLILLALGVSREDALADYLYTNVCLKAQIDAALLENAQAIAADPAVEALIRRKVGVSAQFAREALEQLYGRFGSFETYLEAEYGIDNARLADLRNFYLE